MIRLKLYGPNTRWNEPTLLFVADDDLVRTATGTRAIEQLRPGAAAYGRMPGHIVDGEEVRAGAVRYFALVGAAAFNKIRVVHALGDFGVGHENRAIAVSVEGDVVTVVFGTNAFGERVHPSAADVVQSVGEADCVRSLVGAACDDGVGSGPAGVGEVRLSGGSNSLDRIGIPAGGRFFGHVGQVEVL